MKLTNIQGAYKTVGRSSVLAFVCVSILALNSEIFGAYASRPVEVIITGCVANGVFRSEETDFGTHKSKGGYIIRVFAIKRHLVDLIKYEGQRIRIRGYLLPGDSFFVRPERITKIGLCP